MLKHFEWIQTYRFELIKSYCHLIMKNGILHPMWIENIKFIIRLMLTWVLSKKGLDSVKATISQLELYEIKEMINESYPIAVPRLAKGLVGIYFVNIPRPRVGSKISSHFVCKISSVLDFCKQII